MNTKNAKPDSCSGRRPPASPPSMPIWTRYFIWTLALASGFLALRALFLFADNTAEANRFALLGWGEYGAVIVRNKINALWHAAGMTATAAAFLALCLWRRPGRVLRSLKIAACWVLVALVAADALWLARHYVKSMPRSALATNDVIDILRADQPDRRTALVSQDGFYNFWLTYLFPYHGIRTTNVAQMPRMPEDYKAFLEALGNNPLRLWQLMAVRHILAPAQFWIQISNDPELKESFDIVYAYNVKPAKQGMGVNVVSASPQQPGNHAVIRLRAYAPRYSLLAGWRAAEDEEALRLLASPEYPLFHEALVAHEWADRLPSPSGSGPMGTVERLEYRPGYMRLRVSAPATGVLRISEKYDPDWKAWINDTPTSVFRVDYLFQGVLVEPGLHEVVLRYAPGWWSLAVQAAAIFIFIIAIIRVRLKY